MTGATPSLSPKQVIERLRRPPTEGAPARGDHDLNPGMEPAQSLTPAAVLVPLVTHLDGLTAMFTQRTDHLLHHAGQISFPGGHMDPGDDTPEETALRETHEEIGLPPDQVELIAPLSQVMLSTTL